MKTISLLIVVLMLMAAPVSAAMTSPHTLPALRSHTIAADDADKALQRCPEYTKLDEAYKHEKAVLDSIQNMCGLLAANPSDESVRCLEASNRQTEKLNSLFEQRTRFRKDFFELYAFLAEAEQVDRRMAAIAADVRMGKIRAANETLSTASLEQEFATAQDPQLRFQLANAWTAKALLTALESPDQLDKVHACIEALMRCKPIVAQVTPTIVLLRNHHEFGPALTLCERSLKLTKEDASRHSIYFQMSLIERTIGKMEMATEHALQAMRILEKLRKSKKDGFDFLVAASYDDVAELYAKQEKWEPADKYWKQGIELMEPLVHLSPQHEELMLHCLMGHARMLGKGEKIQEAIDVYEEAYPLAYDCAKRDPVSQGNYAGDILNSTAWLLLLDRQYQASISKNLEAIEYWKAYAMFYPIAAAEQMRQCYVRIKACRLQIDGVLPIEEFEAHFQVLQELVRAAPAEYAEKYVDVGSDLAGRLKNLERYEEAADCYAKTITMQRSLRKTDVDASYLLATMQANYGRTLYDWGKNLEAGKELEEAMAMLEDMLSEHQEAVGPAYVRVALWLTDNYRELDSLDRAKATLAKAYPILDPICKAAKYSDNLAPDLATDLAIAEHSLENFASVEKYLRLAEETSKRILTNTENEYDRYLSTLDRLRDFYQDRREFAKSAAIIQTLYDTHKKYEAQHPGTYPRFWGAWHQNLGLQHMYAGDFLAARAAFEKAISVDQELLESGKAQFDQSLAFPLYNLGTLRDSLTNRHDYLGAVATQDLRIATAQQARPHLPNVDSTMASLLGGQSWYLVFAGRLQESRTMGMEALALDTTQNWIRTNIGHAYLLTGAPQDEAKALEVYGEYLAHSTDRATGISTLQDDWKALEEAQVLTPAQRALVEKARAWLQKQPTAP